MFPNIQLSHDQKGGTHNLFDFLQQYLNSKQPDSSRTVDSEPIITLGL